MKFLQWYTLSKPLPEPYNKKFLPLEKPDEATLHWLDQAKELSSNLWLQLWHLVARTFLGFFMTQTSINGYEKPTKAQPLFQMIEFQASSVKHNAPFF